MSALGFLLHIDSRVSFELLSWVCGAGSWLRPLHLVYHMDFAGSGLETFLAWIPSPSVQKPLHAWEVSEALVCNSSICCSTESLEEVIRDIHTPLHNHTQTPLACGFLLLCVPASETPSLGSSICVSVPCLSNHFHGFCAWFGLMSESV